MTFMYNYKRGLTDVSSYYVAKLNVCAKNIMYRAYLQGLLKRPSPTRIGLTNREVADPRTAGIFIRNTACFHCYSISCDS